MVSGAGINAPARSAERNQDNSAGADKHADRVAQVPGEAFTESDPITALHREI